MFYSIGIVLHTSHCDILLVCVSIAIWGTPVTMLQFFGYSLALISMIYFKLSGHNIKAAFSEAGRKWTESGLSTALEALSRGSSLRSSSCCSCS